MREEEGADGKLPARYAMFHADYIQLMRERVDPGEKKEVDDIDSRRRYWMEIYIRQLTTRNPGGSWLKRGQTSKENDRSSE